MQDLLLLYHQHKVDRKLVFIQSLKRSIDVKPVLIFLAPPKKNIKISNKTEVNGDYMSNIFQRYNYILNNSYVLKYDP